MSISSGVDLATVGLRIDGNGAVATLDQFERKADRAGRSGDRLEKTARGLRTALAAMGLALGAREIIDYADSWNMLQGRISLTTNSTRQAAVVTDELFAAAQRARTGIEPMADLYSRTARAADQVGASQRDIIDFTETVSKGFIVSSASVRETEAAIYQLGQALQSGVLQGDELRTLREGAPLLLRAIAEHMGVTVGQLKKLGAEGKLTSQQVFEGILAYRERVEEMFAKMPVTIGQSFTVLNNELRKYIGGADDATDASRIVGAGILFIAQHLDTLVKALGFAVLVWGSYNLVLKTSALLSAAMAGWKALLAAASAPVVAAAVAETAAIRANTKAIAGYETAAVSSGVASTVMAGGMTRAAVAAGVLRVAGTGLLAVLTGPVGIALALATVIALLLKYKASTDSAAAATEQFRASLAGMSKTQLLVTEADLDRQIWENQRLLEQMRAQRQDKPSLAERAAARAAALLGTDIGQPLPAAPTESGDYKRLREATEALVANRAAVDEQKTALAELEVPIGRVATAAQEMSNKAKRAMLDFRNGLREMEREAQHAVDVSTLQGMAQAEANERFAAANGLLRMHGELLEKKASGTLSAAQADQLYGEAQESVARALGLRLEAAERTALMEARLSREDALRASEQAARLADLEGAALTRLTIEYDALNKVIAAQNSGLSPAVLDMKVEDIETDRAARLAEERMNIIRTYREQVRGVATDLFEDISQNGIKAFGNLFGTLRNMLLRFMAEMAAKRFMAAIGDRWGEQFARAFGGVDKLEGPKDRAATALTGSASALSAAASALSAAAARLGGPMGGVGTPTGASAGLAGWLSGLGERREIENQSVALDPLVVTTRRRQTEEEAQKSAGAFARAFTKFIGPALAGYAAGTAMGGGTTSRGMGALGGAATGAAMGFAVGGPIGAAVGGLTGAIGGFLSASKRRAEEEAMLREVLNRNAERIRELSENIQGLVLLSGRNMVAAVSLSRELALLPGGAVNAKGFAEALQGGDTPDFLKQYESRFGLTLQDLGRIARQVGIELYNSAGRVIPAALKQLTEAIHLSIQAATQFGNNLDDIRLRQEARNALFDLTGPEQKLKDAYEQLSQMAPDLLKQMGLANLNLDTDAGRKVLLEGLRDIFRLIEAKQLTPELLGSFADKEGLIRAILEAKAGLDAFKQSLGTVTTDFPKAMDLIIYEQRFGRGVGAGSGSSTGTASAPPRAPDTNPGAAATPRAPINVAKIVVYYSGNAAPGDLANSVQREMEIINNRGGVFLGETVPVEPVV